MNDNIPVKASDDKQRARDEKEKQSRPLYRMFYQVPPHYDVMNRILTFRFDERWRRKAVAECLKDHPEKVIDLCTGTGDLAVRIARTTGKDTDITALDFSETMLEEAEKKAAARSVSSRIHFVLGDVAAMPFPDGRFDAMILGFAFRNLTYRNPKTEVYLREMLRILKEGGRCVIVETSQPHSPVLRTLFHLYLSLFVAGFGEIISGHHGAYRYLGTSAKNYYSPGEVSTLLKQTGFSKISYHRLLGGVAAVYVAIK